MRVYTVVFFFLSTINCFSQDLYENVLSLQEYLGYVKQFHPIVKQANLMIAEGDAKLLKSRGAFDPKLEIDHKKKQFKGTPYYNTLNASFKVPTWYGVELKANFEENDGVFLNPQSTVPSDGLYSVGASISLARGLLINERMSVLKQAKLFKEQVLYDRQLVVNQILFDASTTYFNWLKTYNEKEVYASFLSNAKIRFDGVKKGFTLGERASIDTLEIGITINSRKLELEKATIKYLKATLKLSNFLWLENNTPIELQNEILPDVEITSKIDLIFNKNAELIDSLTIEAHPKLISLDRKHKGLMIDRRLKSNRLLPQIDLEYNFLTTAPRQISSLDQQQYKGGLKVKFPLFLRKERADLKLSKLKLKDVNYEIISTKLHLKNKIKAIVQEISSLERQNIHVSKMIDGYQTLLSAEERKFILGESSIFLINSRESKLIESNLKAIKTFYNYLYSKANLANTLAISNI